ncbi:diiron oxygenase [Nocardia sp. NPDC127579]|uniref:AurF N-oxygenase family protein n=1 Tax=Nocardia sp. NPDC127579 TaxID=3345402 RepID=UPI0036288B9A
MTSAPGYEEILRTLSEGSVHRHFDAFTDIAWDDPEFAIDPDDPRWVLPDCEPLGASAWYQAQPLADRIRIGLARQANTAKVGLQFENLLMRGILEYVFALPNGDPEFRYLTHEVTEESHHTQMFQEFVNRAGVDTPGVHWLVRSVQSFIPMTVQVVPAFFFSMVLCGEEPIDHMQKTILRAGSANHPLMLRIMQIHVAEEARHISFAHEYLRRTVPALHPAGRTLLSLLFPVMFAIACDLIAKPSPKWAAQQGIPRHAMREAFWRSPASRQMRRDMLSDVRGLAHACGLMNPVSAQLWRLLRVDGRASRYRSEPARSVQP